MPLHVLWLVHRETLHDFTVTCLPGTAGVDVSSNCTTALALVCPPLVTVKMTVRFADTGVGTMGGTEIVPPLPAPPVKLSERELATIPRLIIVPAAPP